MREEFLNHPWKKTYVSQEKRKFSIKELELLIIEVINKNDGILVAEEIEAQLTKRKFTKEQIMCQLSRMTTRNILFFDVKDKSYGIQDRGIYGNIGD